MAESTKNALMKAAAEGDIDFVNALLKLPLAESNFLSKVVKTRSPCYEMTPLSKAAENGHVSIVESLTKIYSKAGNYESGCPLQVACSSKHHKCVEVLIRNMPHLVNAKDEDGYCPIHIAAKTGQVELTRLLVEGGANVNATAEVRYLMHRDYGKYTPLYLAAYEGHTEIVDILLQNGADPHIEVERDEGCLDLFISTEKMCPLSVAAYMGHLKTLQVLSKAVTLNRKFGTRAVILAAIKQRNECLRYLLKNGAPTFSLRRHMTLRNPWIEILKRNANTDISLTIGILLQFKTSLNDLATCSSLDITDNFAGCHRETMKYILDSGFFELRYQGTTTDSDIVAKPNDTIKLDFFNLFGYFKYWGFLRRMDVIFDHFPVIIHKPDLTTVNLAADDAIQQTFGQVSTLKHLCRWKIRCSIVNANGYVSTKFVDTLILPKRIKRFLMFQKNAHL